MTTPASDDRVVPKDPRLDAAWRAASNEEPPAALDAAILAAARRETGAGPRSARAQMAMDTRRRWWPLAAAATVAAVAVGVLELVTPDQLSAPSLDSTTVTDMPSPNAKPAQDAAQQENSAAGDAARPIGAPRQEASGARPTPREDAAKASASAQRRAPPIEAQRTPSPFPAAPATSQTSADAIAQPPAAANARPPALASEATSVPEAPSARARAAAAPAPMAAPAPSAAAPAMAGAVSERPTPLAKTLAGSAQADQAAEARIKDRPMLPVADWIALIQRLRTEGKTTEAAKELAAFRVAHSDHEKLLPPDLRDWRPPTQ